MNKYDVTKKDFLKILCSSYVFSINYIIITIKCDNAMSLAAYNFLCNYFNC